MGLDATSRRQFLAAASLQGLGAPGLLGKPPERPNVLFILADEWRAQATGYNGDRNARTPVLDRLAAESVNFQNAVSGTPVCCPYRASLLTGQYPLTHGVFINDVELKPKGVTWGETFARAGYQTGFIGKWHVYGSPDGQYGRRLAYIPPEKRFGFEYWKACECSHEYNHSLYYEGNDPTPRYWPGYDAIAQTDDACAFIERQAKAREAYSLMLSLGPPHFPYATAPAKYRALYESREIQLRPNVPPEHREEAMQTLRGYYAHMAALDDCLARLLGTLERSGTAENTIVVFTSDHGDMMRSQGLTTKLYPWDESVRVPFLLRYPRRFGTKGRVVGAPLNSPDILPTLLGLCGLPVPDGVEGVDFSGARRARSSPAAGAAQLAGADHRGARIRIRRVSRIANGPVYLRPFDSRAVAALRQPADPYQMHNLCGQNGHRDVQSRLDRDLDADVEGAEGRVPAGARIRERARASAITARSTCRWGRSRVRGEIGSRR